MTAKIDSSKLLFTADLHLFHAGVIRACARPFANTDEMNSQLIINWNTRVSGDSIVYVLGDVSFGRPDETIGILRQLNGHIVLIRGNHDRKMKTAVAQRFGSVHDYMEIDAVLPGGTKQRICMMHFALRTWNRHHYGSWHLHGHSHGSLPPLGRSMDVGVDTNNFSPYTYGEIEHQLLSQPLHSNDHHKAPE